MIEESKIRVKLENMMQQTALQGITGHYAGNTADAVAKNKKIKNKKNEEDNNYIELLNAELERILKQIHEAIEEIESKVVIIEDQFFLIKDHANATLHNLLAEEEEMDRRLTLQTIEITKLRDDLNNGRYYNGDINDHKMQIVLKQAEIDKTVTLRNLYRETIISTNSTLETAKTTITDAKTRIAYLHGQKELVRGSADPREMMEQLQTEIDLAKTEIQSARETIEITANQMHGYGEVLRYAKSNLEQYSPDCGTDSSCKLTELFSQTYRAEKLINGATVASFNDKSNPKQEPLPISPSFTSSAVTEEKAVKTPVAEKFSDLAYGKEGTPEPEPKKETLIVENTLEQ